MEVPGTGFVYRQTFQVGDTSVYGEGVDVDVEHSSIVDTWRTGEEERFADEINLQVLDFAIVKWGRVTSTSTGDSDPQANIQELDLTRSSLLGTPLHHP